MRNAECETLNAKRGTQNAKLKNFQFFCLNPGPNSLLPASSLTSAKIPLPN